MSNMSLKDRGDVFKAVLVAVSDASETTDTNR